MHLNVLYITSEEIWMSFSESRVAFSNPGLK